MEDLITNKTIRANHKDQAAESSAILIAISWQPPT
jgi:hypothetical protein